MPFYTRAFGKTVKTFIGLSDVPSSYIGEGGKVVAVKSTEDGLEFISINSTYLKLDQTSQQTITGNPILSTLGYLVKDPSGGTKSLEMSGYDDGGIPVYNIKINNSANYPQISMGADGNIIINNSGGNITLEASGDWSLNDDRGIYIASDGTNISLGNSVVGGKILANGYEIATLNTLSTYALTANVPILAPDSASRNLIQPTNATYKALILKGYTSQSANILELQDSSANPIAYFDQTGRLKIGQGTSSTAYDLDITRSSTETSDIWLRLKTARSTSSAAILIDSGSTGNPYIYMSRNGTTQWRIFTNNSSNLEFYSYGTSSAVMTLTRATGAATFAQTINTGGYTVATLPTGVLGARAYVTNALAPTWGAAVVGGGTVKVPVFYDGTNWIVA